MTKEEAAQLSLSVLRGHENASKNDAVIPMIIKNIVDIWNNDDGPTRSMFMSINNKIIQLHDELKNLNGDYRSDMLEKSPTTTKNSDGEYTSFAYLPESQFSVDYDPFLENDPYWLNKAAYRLDPYYKLLYKNDARFENTRPLAGTSSSPEKISRSPNGWWKNLKYVPEKKKVVKKKFLWWTSKKVVKYGGNADKEEPWVQRFFSKNEEDAYSPLLTLALSHFNGTSFTSSSALSYIKSETNLTVPSRINTYANANENSPIIAFLIGNSARTTRQFIQCISIKSSVINGSGTDLTFDTLYSYGSLPRGTQAYLCNGWPVLSDGNQRTYGNTSSVTYLTVNFRYARDAFLKLIDELLIPVKAVIPTAVLNKPNYSVAAQARIDAINAVVNTSITTSPTKFSTSSSLTTFLSNISSRLTDISIRVSQIETALGSVKSHTGESNDITGSGLYKKRYQAIIARFDKAFGSLQTVIMNLDSLKVILSQSDVKKMSNDLSSQFMYVSDVSDILSSRQEIFMKSSMMISTGDLDLIPLMKGPVVIICDDAIDGDRLFFHANIVDIGEKSKLLPSGMKSNSKSVTGMSSMLKTYVSVKLDRKIPVGYEVTKSGKMRVVKFLEDPEIEIVPYESTSGNQLKTSVVGVGKIGKAIIGRQA